MTSRPLVSVLTPAFNAAATIAETLASVRSQTYPHFEVLVFDDGSTDRTADVARAAFGPDTRFRLLSGDNQGAAAARNRALAEAAGDFVAPLDADDLWRPEYLERQLQSLQAAPDAGFVYALHRRIDGHSRVTDDFQDFGCSGPVFLQHLLVNFVGNGSAAVFRRAAIEEAGGWDVRSREWGGAEDYLLQLKVAARRPVAANPAYLVGYRARRDSLSAMPLAALRSRLATVEVAMAGRPSPGPLRSWIAADAAFVAAAQLIKTGRPAQALTYLARAGLTDPRQALAQLTQRLANRRPGARSCFAGQRFLDTASSETSPPAPSGLLAARLRWLAELDRAGAA